MTDQPWTALRYAVADVEGNGQQPPDLVELAIMPITDGTPGQVATWLVRPPRPITGIAARIHKIRNDDVATAPPFADIEQQVRDSLAGRLLIAHNAHVDLAVLQRCMPGWQPPGTLDTLRLARRLHPGLPSYKLGSLVTTFGLNTGLPLGMAPHRAAYDVTVTTRLFLTLATRPDGTLRTIGELQGTTTSTGGTDPLF
jgi:exodeoxyribonuclease X